MCIRDRNNREYKLSLTEAGWEIYRLHEVFDEKCLQRTCAGLDVFTDEELRLYIAVQEKLNEDVYKRQMCSFA